MKVFGTILRYGLLILLFSASFWAIKLSAQDTSLVWSPQRILQIAPGTDSLLIDSLPVIQTSIELYRSNGEPSSVPYRVSGKTYSYIVFESSPDDTLNLKYQVVELQLNTVFQNKDTTLIIPEITNLNSKLYSPDKTDFKPFQGLDSKGSISRSISIGSNQDAVLNSSLNLQLSGKLGNNTEIRASITDNNLPVQSDGYTQQLREFDRVYIELENPSFGLLRAGDYNMTSTENYFLQFDKRISGAGLFTKIPLENSTIPIVAQAGIARGKFARNRFQGQEGNQGPYKLNGANGERFIIIISGSERIYIDGILMQRGQQNDYVMDYNAGEITFTALRPITKESRVVVEFQYTEQNYLRSVVFGSSGFESEKFRANVSVYSEQDSKNQSLSQDLTDDEKRILSNTGDALQNALVPTIVPVPFQDDIVLYELRDSLGIDSVLVYSIDSSKQLYQASFTLLGTNKGNYILTPNNANGRVFKWVPPLNGIPQGIYEPVRQLVAPNKLQIISIETEAQIGENQKLKIDLAASNYDLNLFSDLGEANDVGSAGKIQYEAKGKWSNTNWFSQLRYEYNQENFRTVERIRNVEFARDWNFPLNYNGAVQLSGLTLGIKQDVSRIQYQLEYLNIEGYNGVKNTVAARLRNKENVGKLNLSWLTTNDSLGSSDFLREKGEFTHYIIPDFWIGLRSEGELNQRQSKDADTLSSNSYNFLQYQVFTGIGDTAASFAEIYFLQRSDDTALDGRFQNFSIANTYGLRSSVNTSFNSRLELFANVRNLKVFLSEEEAIERTTTGRANYVQRFFGNSVTSSTFYEVGSGTEPRRSFSYIEVPAGTGIYTHTDYNDNGIKELDEFEIAPTSDLAKYVRVFIPSTDYLRTSINKFGENLNINTPTDWSGKEDIRKTISHFSLLFNYQLDRKTLLTGKGNNLNPFRDIDDDSLIVALNNTFRNTLFFNRTSSTFGMDYTYRSTDSRALLSFGVEERSVTENSLNLRYKVIEPLLFRTSASFIDKRNVSQNFSRRNFSISAFSNKNSLAYQPGDKFLITGKFEISNQQGTADEEVKLAQRDFGLELSYNLAESFAALGQLNYILNAFEGNSNNPAAFEMLQGLKPGKNVTWNITLQQTIRKNILLSLNYSGRISEQSFPINTGSLQVKAFF